MILAPIFTTETVKGVTRDRDQSSLTTDNVSLEVYSQRYVLNSKSNLNICSHECQMIKSKLRVTTKIDETL